MQKKRIMKSHYRVDLGDQDEDFPLKLKKIISR